MMLRAGEFIRRFLRHAVPDGFQDGVFMPAFSPSAVGGQAVRRAYDAVFRAIKLDVKFDVIEIVEVAPDWAFARTNSAGTVSIYATGATSVEANQELFVFHKDVGGVNPFRIMKHVLAYRYAMI